MKEILDENKPTAKEMNLPEEFVYSKRIIDVLSKIDFNKKCDVDEAIHVIQKVFIEYKNKFIKEI